MARKPHAQGPEEERGRGPRTARAVAIQVLFRVASRGAYASRALDAELARARLDPRDSALATEIVYGALRVLPELDAELAARLRRGLDQQEGMLLAALRAGCYQLRYLSRVPAHAAVDETVTALRAARGPALANVANAVLRRLAEAGGPRTDPEARALAVAPWLRAALLRSLGEARAQALLAGDLQPPPLCLRIAGGPEARDALANALRAARPEAQWEPGLVSPRALLGRRSGDPRALPGHAEGRFSVQEEGSQAVALALGAQPGETVLDLCAGHGGKTALLAEAVGADGEIVAVDIDERKLERIPGELARLGLTDRRVDRRAIDLSVGRGGLTARFDRVLVDAPCSGLGTLRRRPELLLRRTEADLPRLAALQLAILRNAAQLVRPGGVLLYAVCSPLAEEGASVAAALAAEFPQLERAWEAPALSLALAPDADGAVRIGPWFGANAGSPDAYQLIRFRVRGA